jgi:hypothetical protein
LNSSNNLWIPLTRDTYEFLLILDQKDYCHLCRANDDKNADKRHGAVIY